MLSDQIKKLCESLGVSLRKLSIMSGVDYSSFLNIVSGKSKNPSLDFYKKMLDFGVNLVWLVTGSGDMFLSQKQKTEEKTFLIPLLDQRLSAGCGSDLPDTDEPVSMIPVPNYLRPYKKDLAALYVDGDSMEPTLYRGDLVVCDSYGWSGEGIYALQMNGNGYVKRLSSRPGKLMIISDNKQYQTIEEPIESEAVKIIGRVRCVVKKV